jgi:hypothetical protein
LSLEFIFWLLTFFERSLERLSLEGLGSLKKEELQTNTFDRLALLSKGLAPSRKCSRE